MNRSGMRAATRRAARLEVGDVSDLPDPVIALMARDADPAGTRDPGDAVREWVTRVRQDWGECGRVVHQADALIAVAVYAPPALLPWSARRPSGPVSADSVLLAAVYVDPAHRRRGVARQLVQSSAKELVQRGERPAAVEAFAGTGPDLLPEEFYARLGFGVHRAHLTTPRMRMDLRLTVRARAESAWNRLVAGARPRPIVATPPLGRGTHRVRAGRTAP